MQIQPNFQISFGGTKVNVLYFNDMHAATEKKQQSKKIKSSVIIRKNGEKIGLIGIAPLDYSELTFINKDNSHIEVQNFEKSLANIRKEVKKLRKKDVKIIFLLAHTGEKSKDNKYKYYQKFAEIEGISLVIGGHDHRRLNRWAQTKQGKPVKIVSTGKYGKYLFGENLDSFGVLHLELDDNGVPIKNKCKNSFKQVSKYQKSPEVEKMIEKYFQNTKVIAELPKPLICNCRLTQENPIASLLADACLWMVNKLSKTEQADFAFVNSGTIRENFNGKKVSIGNIKQVAPFTSSKLIKTTLTKKQVINTLNWCAESTGFNKISPGIMQVSGLKYTVGKDLTVKDVYVLNKDGSIKENLSNAPDDKKYTVVYDVFLMTGVAGLKDLIKNPFDKSVEYFPYSRQDALISYFKKLPKHTDLSFDTPRILIEK